MGRQNIHHTTNRRIDIMTPITRTQANYFQIGLVVFALAVVFVFAFSPDLAHASTTGTGLPWEDPLKKVKDSLSGPVAMAISLIAVVVCGVSLVWGGELNEFSRKAIMVVFAIALIVGANSMISTLFGSGAVIGVG